MTAFVDTNVLVYAHDRADPAKRKASSALLLAEGSYAVSGQVLGEFYVTLIRKLHVTAEVASTAVSQLARQRVVAIDGRLVQQAVSTSDRHQLSYWDALIVEAAASAGCDRLLTEDLTHGQTIRGVQIINPYL